MLPEGYLLGYYRLVRRIGSGGMGEVYLAEDTRINRQVAIKVVHAETDAYPNAVATQDALRLFQREMRAIAMLDHPHILPLIDFGEEKDGKSILTYMVMPLRQEGSLTDWLQRRGTSQKLTQSEVSHFVMQAADALQHAHDHHLIHQDVKPSNFLMRERSGRVLPDLLLMDFGIVKMTTATATATQSIRGTPAFMAPEQWKGQPQPATDQYALAVMAYLLLTGRTPFSGRMEQVMHEHLMVQPQPPSSLNSAISPVLDAVILRALEKEPDKRFPSILAFAQAFQQALQVSDNQDPTITQSTHLEPTGSTQTAQLGRKPRIKFSRILLIITISSSLVVTGVFAFIICISAFRPQFTGDGNPFYTFLIILLVTGMFLLIVTIPVWIAFFALRLKRRFGRRFVWLMGGVLGLFLFSILISITVQNATRQGNYDATSTAQAGATAQVIANNRDPYSPPGTLALYDPLSDNSKGYGWDEATTTSGDFCRFIGGAYHANQTDPQYLHQCVAEATDFSNFTFEVQMKITKGGGGGIYFRANNTTGTAYYLRILRSGNYILDLFGTFGSAGKTLASGPSSAIQTGLNQTNLIAVVANRNTFDLYVNGQKIGSVDDNTYSHGEIGVTADYAPAEVAYSNAKVWTL